MVRTVLLFVFLSPALLFSAGQQDKCAQGLLVRGGENHLTPIRMAVSVATEVAARKGANGWATLEEICAVLIALDPGYFAQWKPEIHLLGVMRYLQQNGSVERSRASKFTLWRLTPKGSNAVGSNLALLGKAYDLGRKRRREEEGLEGFTFYPEWTPFTGFKEAFHQELVMTFVVLNCLEKERYLPLADLSERIKTEYAGAGYWQERKNGGAYPTQLKDLLDKMVAQDWVESKKGSDRRFFYRLSPGGEVPIYQVRAFAVRLFQLLASAEPQI